MRIAVVGAGISGLVVAHLLHRTHDITVFEANSYAGGHTNTIRVDTPNETHQVDTGFIVFNDRNYPNFQRLLERLAVGWQRSTMSFSVSDGRGDFEYCSASPNGLFAKRAHVLSPGFNRMVADLARFNRAARALLGDRAVDLSLGDWLERHDFSRAFVERLIVPQASAMWSADPGQMWSFSGRFLVEFFDNHGMLSFRGRPRWQAVRGGSARYVEVLTRPFGERLRLHTPVDAVTRHADHVLVKPRGGEEERFDEVVMATYSDQSLALLCDASDREHDILGAIPYQPNEAVRGCERELYLRGLDSPQALRASARVQPQAGARVSRPRRAPGAAWGPTGRPAAGTGPLSSPGLPGRSRSAAAPRRARLGDQPDGHAARGSDPAAVPPALVRAPLQPRQLLLLHGPGWRASAGAGRGGDEHTLGRATRLRPGRRARKIVRARWSVRQGATCVAVHGHGSSLPGPRGYARPDVSLHIASSCAGATVFDATLALRRRELTRASLAGITARYPFATVRVLALIYAHALGLKLAGVPVHRHPQAPTGMSVWLSRRLVSILLARIKVGCLIVVEGDERRVYGSGVPAAILQIDSSETWPKLLRGSRGMSEAFAQGLWNSPDLVALIRLAACNVGGLDRLRSLLAPVRWPLQRARALVRRSTKRRRRHDIAAHYDLGNALFSHMLDPTMSYSCAVFEHEGMTLEQAQLAKLEREQHDYAVAQVRRAGLNDRVAVLMEDYRDLRGGVCAH
jgi:uncharacterized protein